MQLLTCQRGRCRGVVTGLPVVPGYTWRIVRELNPGEKADPDNGFAFCSNRQCGAKYEIELSEAAA